MNRNEDSRNDRRNGNEQPKRLVIRRKRGEGFKVGEAKVTILSLGTEAARIVIEAPSGVAIVRSELFEDERQQP